MPEKRRSLSENLERIKISVQKLPAAASTLNEATDQLGKSVSELDTVLKKFSLGIPTWVSFHESSHPDADYYYHEDIGYAKIRGKWGIAIRTIECYPHKDEMEHWLFNDAPRLLRVKAVERIPELLEELLKDATRITAEITEKATEVDAYTEGIREILEAPISATGCTIQELGGTERVTMKKPGKLLEVPVGLTGRSMQELAGAKRTISAFDVPEGK